MIRVSVRKQLGRFAVDATFESETRGVLALFGRSGAGKSSIVDMIAGLMRPDGGRIEVDGRVFFDSEMHIDTPPEKRRLGYVFQDSRLFPHYSVRGNLEYGRRRASADDRRIALDDVVHVLGIETLLDRRPAALSGGERQRVALGRALLANPRLLLMDEPLASLDAARKFEILPFIERMRDAFEVPIVYVSHQMNEIVRLADTLALVDNGRIAALGPVDEITSRLDLRPLTGRYEAGSTIRTTVIEHDDKYGLTHLAFPGGTLRVPRIDVAPGSEYRLRVRARDVSLSSVRPEGLSDLNILEGTVAETGATPGNGGSAHIDLRLDIGVPLWVRISRWSYDELGLQTGSRVYALIKSTSIDRQSMGERKDSAETETDDEFLAG